MLNAAVRFRRLASSALPLVVVAIVSFPGAAAAADEENFKPLCNGKDLSNFDIVGSAESWSVDGDVIKCTGKPAGYLVTKQPYKNYSLRFDYCFPDKPGNSGYLIHITGEDKVWPKCIEVQGHFKGVGIVFPIGGAKGPRPAVDNEAKAKVLKPPTEWNSLEIVSQDGALTVLLNETKICESEPYELKQGRIGFQSEGAEIHFRNLRLKEL
jgi:hypothetical protein